MTRANRVRCFCYFWIVRGSFCNSFRMNLNFRKHSSQRCGIQHFCPFSIHSFSIRSMIVKWRWERCVLMNCRYMRMYNTCSTWIFIIFPFFFYIYSIVWCCVRFGIGRNSLPTKISHYLRIHCIKNRPSNRMHDGQWQWCCRRQLFHFLDFTIYTMTEYSRICNDKIPHQVIHKNHFLR